MGEIFVEAKVVVLGDTGVGKTSIVMRFVEQKFSSNTPPTVGASFLSKSIWCSIKTATMGYSRARKAPMYYRGAAVALLVYDVTNEDTFESIKEWVKELRSNVFDDIFLVLAANQVDKPGRKVSLEEGSEFARSINSLYFETSAKKGTGVDTLFLEVAKHLVNKVPEVMTPPSPTVIPASKELTGGDSKPDCNC